MARYMLSEATHKDLAAYKPNVAVLPWGATEGHGQHLPYGTDTIQSVAIGHKAAELADARGARLIVLPPIPFGNDAMQVDQAATIHISTATAMAMLRDTADSLRRQGITRLVILNGHGGNEFRPLIRDLELELRVLLVQVDWWRMCPELFARLLEDRSGDHADEMETSVMLHVAPHLVKMADAGTGQHVPFAVAALTAPGVWTPRHWSKSHPDLGSGNPAKATAEKGRQIFEAVTAKLADLLVELSKAAEVP